MHKGLEYSQQVTEGESDKQNYAKSLVLSIFYKHLQRLKEMHDTRAAFFLCGAATSRYIPISELLSDGSSLSNIDANRWNAF